MFGWYSQCLGVCPQTRQAKEQLVVDFVNLLLVCAKRLQLHAKPQVAGYGNTLLAGHRHCKAGKQSVLYVQAWYRPHLFLSFALQSAHTACQQAWYDSSFYDYAGVGTGFTHLWRSHCTQKSAAK